MLGTNQRQLTGTVLDVCFYPGDRLVLVSNFYVAFLNQSVSQLANKVAVLNE